MIKQLWKGAAVLTVLAALVTAIGCKQTVTVSDTKPPAEVTELTAAAGNGTVLLSWKNPADEDLYQVKITADKKDGTLANAVYLAAKKGEAMSFKVEGLQNATAYTFTVQTLDKALNESKGVSTKEAVTPKDSSDTTAPAEVTELTAEALAGGILLTWKDPADKDLWGIEISSPQEIMPGRAAAFTPKKSFVVARGQQGVKIANLSAGESYTFTVKTIDTAGNKSAGTTTEPKQPQSGGSPMTLTLTSTPALPAWTKDKVTVTVTSSTTVTKATWTKTVQTVKEMFESGTVITDNTFEVTENGTYFVAVQDNDGRREVETIKITNIDKTAPQAPVNFTAEYKLSAKTIVLKWIDPSDAESGLKELKLTYTVNGVNPKTETVAAGKHTFEITGVEPQTPPALYDFNLKAVDNAGNEGKEAKISVTPSEQAEITGISLDRTHLDTIMTNRDIVVTITGSNFDKLTSLLVQVTDGSTSKPPVTADIDKPNNKATATVQAPKPTRPTDAGTTYTVKAIVNSTTPAEATASFKVSNPARVASITLTSHQLAVGSPEKIRAEVTGTNFDIRGETQIKLLDSSGAELPRSTVPVPADTGNATGFTAELTLPTESGVYTAAVYFDDVKEAKTTSLQLYGSPEITSVSLPKAGTGYGGNKLPVRITGKNFTAPGISAASFTGTPALSDVKIESDTLVMATVLCPYTAGESNLTVTCTPQSGAAVTGTGNIVVKDYSAYTVGKIVLKDGSLVAQDDYAAIESSNPPVAVIVGVNGYGRAIGIGLHTSESGLKWAKGSSTGYYRRFEDIICTPSATGSGAAATARFDGDTDGSDNWDYICGMDAEGTANAAENYPAFHWVNQYNTTYAGVLAGADIKWYMPSLAELCEVYKHKDTINGSLAKIRSLPNGQSYADQSLVTSYYWSSSQFYSLNSNAWQVDFGSGSVGYDYKYDYYRVCCLSGL